MHTQECYFRSPFPASYKVVEFKDANKFFFLPNLHWNVSFWPRLRSREKSQLVFVVCPQSLSLNREKSEASLVWQRLKLHFCLTLVFKYNRGLLWIGEEGLPPLTEVTGGVKYSGREGGGAVWKYVSVEPDVFYRLLVLEFLILLLN